jgi:Fe2+ or Zn2+ uptake regulation protein
MARKSQLSAAMVTLMARGAQHAWTLEDLQADLSRGGARPDFSSVFRAAEKLVGDGIVRKLRLDDGRARFELVAGHHDHLHCTRCDALIPVSCVLDLAAFAALEAEAGILITEHQVVLSGLCPSCRQAAATEKRDA